MTPTRAMESGIQSARLGDDAGGEIDVAAARANSPPSAMGTQSSDSPTGMTHVEEIQEAVPFSPPSLGPGLHRPSRAQAFASAPVAEFGVASLDARRIRPASPSNSPSTPPPTWGRDRERRKGRIATPPSAPVSTMTRRLFDTIGSVPAMPPLHNGLLRTSHGLSSLDGAGIVSENASARIAAHLSTGTRLSRAAAAVKSDSHKHERTTGQFPQLAASKRFAERCDRRPHWRLAGAGTAGAAAASLSSAHSSSFAVSASSSATSARHNSPGSVGAKGFREGAGLFDDVPPASRHGTAASSSINSRSRGRPRSLAALPSPDAAKPDAGDVAAPAANGVSARDLGTLAAGSVLSDESPPPEQAHEPLSGLAQLPDADARGSDDAATPGRADGSWSSGEAAEGRTAHASAKAPSHPPNGDLEAWVECFDEDTGFAYYSRLDPTTGEETSRWAEAGDWERSVDPDSGFPYLCNRFTGETAWEHEEALATASPSLQLVFGSPSVDGSSVDTGTVTGASWLRGVVAGGEAVTPLAAKSSPVLSPARGDDPAAPQSRTAQLLPLDQSALEATVEPSHEEARAEAASGGREVQRGVEFASAAAWSGSVPDVQVSQWDTDDAASALSGGNASANAYASGYEAADDAGLQAGLSDADGSSRNGSDTEPAFLLGSRGMPRTDIATPAGDAGLRVRTPNRPAMSNARHDSVTSSELESGIPTPMVAEAESAIQQQPSGLPPRPSPDASLAARGGPTAPRSAARRRRARPRDHAPSSGSEAGSAAAFAPRLLQAVPSPLGSVAAGESDHPAPLHRWQGRSSPPSSSGHGAASRAATSPQQAKPGNPRTPQDSTLRSPGFPWSAPLPHSPYGYDARYLHPGTVPAMNTPSAHGSQFSDGGGASGTSPYAGSRVPGPEHLQHQPFSPDPRFAPSPTPGSVGIAYMPGPYGYPVPVQVPMMPSSSPAHFHMHGAGGASPFAGAYPPAYYPGVPGPFPPHLYGHPSGMYPHEAGHGFDSARQLPQVADALGLPRPGQRGPSKAGRSRFIEQLGLTGSRRDSASAARGAAMAAGQRHGGAMAPHEAASRMARRLDFDGQGHDRSQSRGGGGPSSRAEQIRALASLLRASAASGGKADRFGNQGGRRGQGPGHRRPGNGRGDDNDSGDDDHADEHGRRSSRRRRRRNLAWDAADEYGSDGDDDAKHGGGLGSAGAAARDVEAGYRGSRRSRSRSRARREASRSRGGRQRTSDARRGSRRHDARETSRSSHSGSEGSSSYGTDDVESDLEGAEVTGSIWGITAAIGSLFGSGESQSPTPRTKPSKGGRKRGAHKESPSPVDATRAAAGLQPPSGAAPPPPPGSDLADEDTGIVGRLSTAGAVAHGELKMSVGGVEVGLTLQERLAQIRGALGAVGSAAARALAATGVPAMDGFIAAAHSGTGRIVSALEGEDDGGMHRGPVPAPWSTSPSATPALGASAASFGSTGTRRPGHRGSVRSRGMPEDVSGAAVPALVGRPVLANPTRTGTLSSAAGALPFARPGDDSGAASSLAGGQASSPLVAGSGAKRGPGVRSHAAAEAGWGAGPAPAGAGRRGSRNRAASNDPGAGRHRSDSQALRGEKDAKPHSDGEGSDVVEAVEPQERPSSAAFEPAVSAEEAADFDAAIV